MEDMMKLLDLWIAKADDPVVQEQLQQLKAGDETAVRDAFYQDLAFGTGGLRGIVGAGPNRMNVYTVAKATQGLANYLNASFDAPSVAIARDSRNMGETFVQVAAGVLAANGIRSHLYPRIEPTPALSFAVRDLGCAAGICMTASHNPAPYNGYKAYGPDGCQITTQAAHDIQAAINAVDIFDDVKRMPFDQALAEGWASYTDEGTLDRFVDAVFAQSLEEPGTNADAGFKVVYTPLNGTGLECVTRILERVGVTDVTLVEEQTAPDGNFPTCPYPNPEIREALERGLALCEDVRPDLLLATDPDADRVGVAALHDGEYHLISGNEMGILLLDYICRTRAARGEDLSRAVSLTTIVSTAMVDALAAEYGFQLRRTLTGFKYIGEQIGLLEAAGTPERFIFGFEESYGYLSGTHVRDKDAVNASMLICQMARDWKARGVDLVEAMDALYRKHGYHRNATISLEYPGAAGAEKMAGIMSGLSANAPQEVAGLSVTACVDYQKGVAMPYVGSAGADGEADAPQTLPAAGVFEMQLEGGSKLIVRPSGTEPKIKAYLFAACPTPEEAADLLAKMDEAARAILA
ncbi:phospho-sugar mutase [Adlercreutzia sp. ZJ242]|uniref:phospho-sugar mutase n=1 Tax=Adlercreutzia sp. ZJ242 TaxID=2709409 RepID=UPI0013EA38A7|nr:phospho-sugar mutase [Adlercreutzia sp. ZJ242]